jgi:hypothetical protein
MLMNGYFGETNLAQAAVLFRAAAEQGYPLAQLWSGLFLAQGKAGTRDFVEAWKWLELAAAAKNTNATPWLQSLQRTMSPEQIEEGRRRAREFKPRIKAPLEYMTPARPKQIPTAAGPQFTSARSGSQ